MPHCLKTGKEILAQYPDFALIGRAKEMGKLCTILVRKMSNSVLLVGPSGVGASALCLGLQAMKGDANAPFDIVSKSLFWLNVDELFASGNPQTISTAFQEAMGKVQRAVEPVLILEDAGDFIDACRNHGTNHFINTLNGLVAKGAIQVIMETNDKDVTKVLAWHSDIREAYTILDIPEPVGEDLVAIATAVGDKLAQYHGIRIGTDALETAIELTQKYRQAGSGAAQPKRAIELLDQSLSSYRLSAHVEPPKAAALRKRVESEQATDADRQAYADLMATHAERQAKLRSYHAAQRSAEREIAQLEDAWADEKAKNEAKKSEAAPAPEAPVSFAHMGAMSGFGSPAQQGIADRLEQFRKALREHKQAYETLTHEINAELELNRDAVVAEFAKISGIPAAKLGEDEKAILRDLDTNLKASVFGQDEPVSRVANAIKVSKVGRRNREKPLASFLLAGPSGVGKTEIAKQIARLLLGDTKALTRFDMSEYMERHAVSKLIGAPPGYEGFEAGGILTNAMRTNRNRVILFDEIEKAHPDVFNLFLQILDDGRLTDNIGRVAEFSDAIIIMTTNTGQPHFLNTDLSYEEAMERCMADLEGTYRPEFLNRFNGRENIIGFRRLELPSIERIVQREVGDLVRSYAGHGVDIEVPSTVITHFCADRYDPVVGARGLPGFINANLEPRIVNALLDDKVASHPRFMVGYDAGTRGFTLQAPERAAA